MTRTRIADIAYFLGDDWVDWVTIRDVGGSQLAGRKMTYSTSVPSRCGKCNRAFETRAMTTGTRIGGNRLLPQSTFKNVPLEAGECGMCDG